MASGLWASPAGTCNIGPWNVSHGVYNASYWQPPLICVDIYTYISLFIYTRSYQAPKKTELHSPNHSKGPDSCTVWATGSAALGFRILGESGE